MRRSQTRRKRKRGKPLLAIHAATSCLWSLSSFQPSRAFTVPSRHGVGRELVGRRRRYRHQYSSLFADASGADASSPDNNQKETTTTTDSSSSSSSAYQWNVGNVYDDLDNLRREITMSNAEQHLRQVEDRERLDTFAAHRWPLDAHVRKFVLAPLALSIILPIMTKSRCAASSLARIVTRVLDLHLLVVVVVAPILMLLAKQRSLPPPPPRPSELQGIDSEYYRFVVTDWQDPKTSCRDHVLCLLENWTSAVIGPAILACVYALLPSVSKRASSVCLCIAASQLVTRLGAIAALYQYPKLLYELKRRHQPRPMDRYTMRFQQLTWLALSFAPLGIASDLSKLWSKLPYKLVASLVTLGWVPYVKHLLIRDTAQTDQPLTLRQKLGCAVLMITQLTAVGTMGAMLMSWWKTFTPQGVSYKVVGAAGICLSILLAGPIAHLVAARKLFRINYTHDISLANGYDTIQAYLNDPMERQKRFKWRYRLEWREPERIMETLSQWKGGFSYWLLFEGGVEDQLRKEFQTKQKSAAYREGLTVLQRVEKEMKEKPDTPRPDSTKWKTNAMEKLAAKHEADYQSGTFEDPLGVAVQQTFGIGLGYQFDHVSDLKEGERPSARRLQARAAKSAVRRVQELYDAEAAQQELDSIDDPRELELKKAEMRRATDAEIAYLASQLSNLIPTDLVLENKNRQTKIQQFRRGFKKSSSHEIIVDSPGDDSSSIKSLFGKTDDDPDQSDEEFVEAWIRRQQQQEEDQDNSTILV